MAEIISPERSAPGAGPSLSYWLGTKVLGVPLAMRVATAQSLQHAIEDGAFDAQTRVDLGGVMASKFVGTFDGRSRFRVTDDGIVLVPIQGILIDRGPWLGDLYGFATSYEGLTEQISRIAKDAAIKAVVLDIDSPGGMVAGMFEAAAAIHDLKKPVYTIAANMADSAAYALACVADEVFVTRTGEAGSIGVISLHQSRQRMLDSAGVDTTIIHGGAHKADGNPFQQLSHGARAQMAATCDALYGEFCAHVAKHRGLTEERIRATEALTYIGEKARTVGLVDGVKSFDELLAHVRKGLAKGASGSHSRRRRQVEQTGTPGAQRPDYEAMITAALTTIAAQTAAPKPAAQAPAASDTPAASRPEAAVPAATQGDTRDRVKSILTAEAAKQRQGLAMHLALETDVPVDTALAIMAAAPIAAEKAETDRPTDPLATAMAQPGNSGGVRPAAPSANGRGSFLDFVAARSKKSA